MSKTRVGKNLSAPLIMIISEKNSDWEKLRFFISDHYDLIRASGCPEALELFRQRHTKVRLVLLVLPVSHCDEKTAVKQLRQIDPLPQVLVITHDLSIEQVIPIMKAGAQDAIRFPDSADKLLTAISNLLADEDALKKLEELPQTNFLEEFDWQSRYELAKNLILDKHTAPLSEEELLVLFPPDQTHPDEMWESIKYRLENDTGIKIRAEKKPLVLIIEDEEAMSELEKQVLEPNYRVITVVDSLQTLRILNEEKVDVALLDIYLPDINGAELLSTIKHISPDTEVIMITAYGDTDIALQCLKEGACDFIVKPFQKNDLKKAVLKALERRYVKSVLPKLSLKFVQNSLPVSVKISLLNQLAEKRLSENKSLLMQDIYHLFPDLTRSGIPDGVTVPKTLLGDNTANFIHQLSQSIPNEGASVAPSVWQSQPEPPPHAT